MDDTVQFAVDSKAATGEGNAVLTRFQDKFTITGAVDTIDTAHAYTIWLAIFNIPGECEGIGMAGQQLCDVGLDGVDLADAQADRSRAAFGLCGPLTIDGDRHVFDCERAVADGLFEADADGEGARLALEDPLNAEVHVIIRSHGPALTGDQLTEQQTLYNGGCGTGDDNEGMCADVMYFPFRGVDCIPTHGVVCP